MAPRNTKKRLEALLDQRNEHPERLAEVDAQICSAFERERSVLVLDMCGFSRLTIRYGIIHYLAMIRRMQRAVVPLVHKHKGHVFKLEADNVFATFDDVPTAIACARDVHATLALANSVLPADWDVNVAIGIGHGPLLVIGDDDVYGSEMNLASKLGEDIAKGGEVLLTEAAFKQAGKLRRGFQAKRARLGKLSFGYYASKR